MSALNVFRSLRAWFQPFIDAIFGRNITFAQRWRMLLFLQPATFITHPIAALPWVFTRAFHAEYITVAPGRKIRVLVFERKDERKAARNGNKLRPLHLSIHGGGFIGGIPEMCAPFCDPLARETGAVVIAPTYRFAPRYGFPTLIDDIDTVVQYLYQNAAERWGADPELMTISGLSAGGNLAMAATQGEGAHQPAKTALKGIVTFYAVMDPGPKPEEKPRPEDFPKHDPAAVLFPLIDAYGASGRTHHSNDPRLRPILAQLNTLPNDILLIVPSIDILVHEQLTFVERLEKDIAQNPIERERGRRVEALVIEKGFHGWIELPDRIAGPTKREAIHRSVQFIKDIHTKYGWEWN